MSAIHNWPTITVKAWTDDPPQDGSMPTTAGTDLSSRFQNMVITRGRQYELDTDQAGTVEAKLDNSDGLLTAGHNGFDPIRPVTVEATWSGTTYRLFTGYVERFPTQDDNPVLGWANVVMTDLFGPLAQRTCRPAMQEATLAANPTVYYPMNDPALSTRAGNIALGSTSAGAIAAFGPGNQYDGVSLFGASGVVPNDDETSFQIKNSTNADFAQLQCTGSFEGTQFLLDFGKPWAVQVVFVSTSSGKCTLWSALQDKSVAAWIHYDGGTGNVNFDYYYEDGGGSGISIGANAGGANPCHAVFGWDGTHLFMAVNGGTKATTTPSSVRVKPATAVAFGTPWTATSVFGTNNSDYTIGHGAMWLGSVPTDAQMTALGQAARGNVGEYADARITRILSWLGITNTTLDPGLTPLGAYQSSQSTAMVDSLRQTALDDLGRLFIGKDGKVVFRNRNYQQTRLSPQWVFGDQAGELPYTGAPQFDYDPTRIANDVEVTKTTGAITRAVDAASQQKYFQRIMQVSTNVEYDQDALYSAQWLLGRYKNPQPRPETVHLDPGSNPALWPCVLSLELGDLVQLNHRKIGAPAVSVLCTVQQIVHTVDQDGVWTVDLQLSPLITQYWLLAAMHTTVKTTVAAGVSAVTFNPLPDKAYNPAEASLGVGTTIVLSEGTANAETMTIASVTSNPTPGATGYTSFTLTFTAATTKAHNAGDVACDPLPSGVTDPTTWDARSKLDTTTITTY